MLAKIKKSSFVIIASAALLLITLFLNFNKNIVNSFIFNTLETINSYDLGYSSFNEFLGIGEHINADVNNTLNSELIKNTLFIGLPKMPIILYKKISGDLYRSNIDDIALDINFKNFQKILYDRQVAINKGFLKNPRSANARITFQGESYKAKVKLKGYLSDHWRSNLRMSLEISLKDGESILGMRSFSIHSPGSRQYPHEQVYQDSLNSLNNFSMPHKLLRVSVNGTSWGLMNIEERFSKEFIEKQESKESIIFKFSDEQLWQHKIQNTKPYNDYELSDTKFFLDIYQSNNYLNDRVFREQYSYILSKNATNKIHELISIKPTLQAIMLSSIWNNTKALNLKNTSFYLNPYTLELEIISTDQGPIFAIQEPHTFLENLDPFYIDFLLNEVEELDIINTTRNLISMKKKLLDSYSFHKSFFPFDEPINTSLIESNFKKVNSFKENFLKYLKTNHAETSADDHLLPTKEKLISMPAHIHVKHYDNGELWISNLLPVTVNVNLITHLSQNLHLKNIELLPSINSVSTKVIQTPFHNIQDGLIEITTESKGVTKKITNGATLIANTVNPLKAVSNLQDFPFIKKLKNSYIIDSGTWVISKPIVFYGDLQINQGTKLIFEENSYLIVKGSLKSMGTSQNMVEFLPSSNTWKGLYVLGDGSKSLINHTKFTSTAELRDSILQLTSGVTFYNSEVSINNSSFVNAIGEDALNIIKSKFKIFNVTVDGSSSDGIDFDFAYGLIADSNFNNVGGDAIDISGGDVELSKLHIQNVRDKGISAGEGSIAEINLSVINTTGVGIASKDGSKVIVKATNVNNSELFDFMAYSKKNFFDKPSLIVRDHSSPNFTAAKQDGAFMEVNNALISSTKLDINKLYETSVMSK